MPTIVIQIVTYSSRRSDCCTSDPKSLTMPAAIARDIAGSRITPRGTPITPIGICSTLNATL